MTISTTNPGGKRSLINEILSLQVLIIFIIGVLAIASLYWGSQWVLRDSYNRWALQWTAELHELGAPLYVQDDADVRFDLKGYIEAYPEIRQVAYYRLDGSVLYSISNESVESDVVVRSLSKSLVGKASQLVGADHPYVIDSEFLEVHSFRIHAPIWTESITNDGLFDFENLADAASVSELIGYVGLELDFIEFHKLLVSSVRTTIWVLISLLIVFGVSGRLLLGRALKSLSDLQEPIDELAKGNLNVAFKPAAHREISDITEALQTTASSLRERDDKLLILANYDSMTGLLNRRRLVEELQSTIDQLADSQDSAALIFIDLDRFKYVNDMSGHPAGDRMIIRVADSLKKSVGQNGILARFGGDEFVVLAPRVTKRQAVLIAESILENLRQLKHIEGDMVFHIHASVGITLFDGKNVNLDDIVAEADIACREAKARGRNRYEVFVRKDHEVSQIVSDAGWIAKLRDAIDHETFVLNYQPIVDMSTNDVSHYEVLLRMKTGADQIISPDVFLPPAVRFGLMAEIDAWVIEHAIAALAEFRKIEPDLRFAINLSANAFEMENLVSFVQAQLTRHEIPASAVVFEITESLALRQTSHIEYQIVALRELGCEFALDDFGTGYSSFSHLRELSADYLKIDGCFIQNLTEDAVNQKTVQLITEIGKASGKRTVAEYVEDAGTFELLKTMGIDYAQGFYIGKPAAQPQLAESFKTSVGKSAVARISTTRKVRKI